MNWTIFGKVAHCTLFCLKLNLLSCPLESANDCFQCSAEATILRHSRVLGKKLQKLTKTVNHKGREHEKQIVSDSMYNHNDHYLKF